MSAESEVLARIVSEVLARIVYLHAPVGETEAEFWHRKFRESLVALCRGREESDGLEAENKRLRWMFDTIIHEHRERMDRRAGYAKIYELVEADLVDEYDLLETTDGMEAEA